MNISKLYKYLYYKIYKFWKAAPVVWWSDWKASISIDVILLLFLYPFLFYYKMFIDRYLDISTIIIVTIILMIIIFGFNYYFFDDKRKWRKIVRDFDKLPKRKNKIGSWLVFLFIILLLANFLFSMYLGSTVDWSQYRQLYSGGFDGFITDGSAAQDEANEMNQRNGGSAWTRPRIIPWGVK